MSHRTILCLYCNKPLQITETERSNQVTCPICNTKNTVSGLSSSVDELDFYPLNKPYSFISILKEKDSLKKRYVVLEPILSEDDKDMLDFLKDSIVKTLNVRLDELGDEAESYIIDAVEDIVKKHDIILDGISWEKIVYYLKKRFLGYDDIDTLMKDPFIEDISCDGANIPLFVYQRRFGSLETNILFPNDEYLAKFVVKLSQKCGKHISVSDPMLDATMPDGSRIQMTLRGEVTTRGSTFTIRKFKADPITPIDLIDYETFSVKMVAYLWMAVEHGFNALISGGTASGKTSALNALALFIPRESKIVSIEETREINLPHPNWIPGVTRSGFGEVVNDRVVGEIDLFDLMKAALRQRPEYILVGEIRGKEAYVLFQAMATGHTTYSTVHADSTQALIHRLEGKPINIPRTMLQSLDIVLLMRNQKYQDKQQRRCIKVVELLNVDSETTEVLTNAVFEWNPQDNLFSYSGKSYILEQIRTQNDMSTEEMTQELRQRADILTWLNKYHIRKFIDVSNILAKYAETPDKILELIKKEPEKIDEEVKDALFTNESDFDNLLDIPLVVKRNEMAKKIKKEKKQKKISIGSFFSTNKKTKKIQKQSSKMDTKTTKTFVGKRRGKENKANHAINDKFINKDFSAKTMPKKGRIRMDSSFSSQEEKTQSYISKPSKEEIQIALLHQDDEEKKIEFFHDYMESDVKKDRKKSNHTIEKTDETIDFTEESQRKPVESQIKQNTFSFLSQPDMEFSLIHEYDQKKIIDFLDNTSKKLFEEEEMKKSILDIEKEIDRCIDQTTDSQKKSVEASQKMKPCMQEKKVVSDSINSNQDKVTKNQRKKKKEKHVFKFLNNENSLKKFLKVRIRVNKEKLKLKLRIK